MILVFTACVLLVVICLAISLSRLTDKAEPNWPLGISLGVALTPAFISMISYGLFAIAYFFSSRTAAILAPPILALLIALWSKRRFEFGPVISVLSFTGVALAILAPILLAIYRAATIGQFHHDVSLYLTEAAEISQMMRSGTLESLTWLNYANPHVASPHNPIFSIYLAWGFLFTDSPGYGADTIPRLLIGLDHLALIFATCSLVLRPIAWWLGGVAIILTNAIWGPEIVGLSRDSFYLAPAMACLVLLLQTRPTRSGYYPYWALVLGLGAALLGHSLGIFVIASIALGTGVAQLLRHGLQILRFIPFWVTALALGLTAISLARRYYFSTRDSLGFAYTFYADPVHLKYFESTRFANSASPFELLISLADRNGVSLYLLGAVTLLAGTAVLLCWRADRPLIGTAAWIAVLVALIGLFTTVAFLPMTLGEAHLSGSFVANFRYGFSLGILALALVTLSLGIIVQWLWAMIKPGREQRRLTVLLITLAMGSAWQLGLGLVRYVTANNSNTDVKQHALCMALADAGIRRVLIDNDSLTYRCPIDTLYVFTLDGTRITGAQTHQSIADALDKARIDAVIFTLPLSTRWNGTRLETYLAKTWRSIGPDRLFTFVRPGFDLEKIKAASHP